jgi:hypothetical protein
VQAVRRGPVARVAQAPQVVRVGSVGPAAARLVPGDQVPEAASQVLAAAVQLHIRRLT